MCLIHEFKRSGAGVFIIVRLMLAAATSFTQPDLTHRKMIETFAVEIPAWLQIIDNSGLNRL